MSTHSSTDASSPPYAFAFILTAPPTVPGMLTPNSIPVSPARAATRRHRGQPRARAAQDARAVELDLAQLLIEFHH